MKGGKESKKEQQREEGRKSRGPLSHGVRQIQRGKENENKKEEKE